MPYFILRRPDGKEQQCHLAGWLPYSLKSCDHNFIHAATGYNSRHAYASFWTAAIIWGRDRKISSFSFLSSCSKDDFRGKIMSSEAAKN